MAARSLSMAAYRALARRGATRAPDTTTPRPEGQLVFLYIGSAFDLAAGQDLAERLATQIPGVSVLICTPLEFAENWPFRAFDKAVFLAPAPDEHPRSIDQFLSHWQPDLGLWVWGGLRPALIDDMFRRDIPLHLVCADTAGFDGRRERWLPELTRSLLAQFQTLSARDAKTMDALNRLGAGSDRVSITPALQPTGRLLECHPSDLDEMTAHMAGRPAWLAAHVLPEECPLALDAHRIALRSAHRLLLILNPADGCDIPALCDTIEASGLAYAVWADGDLPDETTQVLVAEFPEELGLWYRIATVSFIGQSLVPGAQSQDPMEAAALGTAILYGPHVRAHLASYTRLATVGAARIVNDATSLGTAVGRLIAPDQAAAMAHAGWDVVTQGAEVMDAILALVETALDPAERES